FPQIQDSSPALAADRVALFSGGLDSAAGAATFTQRGLLTIYVSHYVNGVGRLARLLHDIASAYGRPDQARHAAFYVRPKGPVVQQLGENSRQPRPLLFAALALATAMSVGTREVCVSENGPLALNLPLAPGMLPTRHAHSRFLLALERLGRSLFDVPIRVRN